MSLQDSDAEVQQIADALWDKGRVIADKTAREVLLAAGVPPDFEFSGGDAETDLDYIHRRDGHAEIYFVANRANRAESVTCHVPRGGQGAGIVGCGQRPAAVRRRLHRDGRPHDAAAGVRPLRLAGSSSSANRRPGARPTAKTNSPEFQPLSRTGRPVAGVLRSALGRAGSGRVPGPGELAHASRAGHQVLLRHGRLSEDF